MVDILISAVRYFMMFLQFVIIARVLMSWFPSSREGPVSTLIYSLSEPVLGPIRRLLQRTPLSGTMIDLSPIFALMMLRVVESVVVSIIAIAL